ncbi:SDR family oxidoreductase [Knoellia aerolata]|uniref:NmrA family transcriptional regulator n=1 Tax=Knoellia aerolata DSM 18566 TaxID=1385519 RepID=A0A0A0JRQ7_9MICO|nr:SDR family oxidoreductase [Knoellia aerolata]KGN39863.1 NmrA family transcriptional regulator [Knoellia aerolata DSM 18566]
MTTILVTGATGQLGRLAIDSLLARGVAAGDVVALVRDAGRASDLAERGVTVRTGSFDDAASLDAALAGVDRLLFVSGSEVGRRVQQHQNVVDAAVRAGVELVAYTSIVRADTSSLGLAGEHRATEEALAASGLPTVLLRNSWYVENYTSQLPVQLEHGAVLGAAGEGRVSAATRADFAEAAAVVVTEDGHAGQVYELGGDQAFTLAEYAAELSEQSGTPVAYRDLTVADYAAALVGAGLPEGYAQALASSDDGLKHGGLLVETGDLSRLLGRPTTPLAEAIAAAVS